MPTVAAYQLPLRHLRFQQQMMQIFQRLLISLEFLCSRRLLWKDWKSKLLPEVLGKPRKLIT